MALSSSLFNCVKTPSGPLSGLRVVDCSTLIAGPSIARYLGDFGADVVKVERPGTGDTTRSLYLRDPADGVTYFWKFLGRYKRTIVLDLKDTEDLAVMRTLCRCADVLVENFRPGTIERLGIGPDVLLADNPRFATSEGRARHRVAVDAALEVWIGERTEAEVLEAFESVHAAAASVYDMADIAADERVWARGAIVDVDGTPMQGSAPG